MKKYGIFLALLASPQTLASINFDHKTLGITCATATLLLASSTIFFNHWYNKTYKEWRDDNDTRIKNQREKFWDSDTVKSAYTPNSLRSEFEKIEADDSDGQKQRG